MEIYEYKKMDLKGATVIDGFPSVGLVSTIVANYIIHSLDLELIGSLDSPYFPTIAVVRNSVPLSPVRIYAGGKVCSDEGCEQLVVFISEFQPPQQLIRPIANGMLEWMQQRWCSTLISPEGLIIERAEDSEEPNFDVFGIGSTPKAKEMLAKHEVSEFREGAITGVAGVLLNEGKKRGFDVLCLLAEAHPKYPDAGAAAKVLELINKLLLRINIDPKPLYEKAQVIEEQIKTMHAQAKVKPPMPQMYG